MMLDKAIDGVTTAIVVTVKAAVSIVSYGIKVATSPTVKEGTRTTVTTTGAVIIAAIVGVWTLVERTSPTIRKVFRTGILGGWRFFLSQFNRNSANMVRNTRSRLYPLNWIALVGAGIASAVQPLFGIPLLLAVVVIFFQDADNLSFTSFSLDSVGVAGVVGVTTSLIIKLFTLAGALTATWRWLKGKW